VPVELGVFVFPGRDSAKYVLEEVRDRDLAWIRDVPIIERPEHGHVHVHSTWVQNDSGRKVVGLGSVTGALVGVLLGPAGVVTGAALGAAGGGLVGAQLDVSQYDKQLAEIADHLKPDASALMLWADVHDVEAFVATFGHSGTKLVRSSLSDKQARQLRDELRAEPKSENEAT
jgi:uncharacterized membrane protein